MHINLSSGETSVVSASSSGFTFESSNRFVDLAYQIHANMVSPVFRLYVLFDDETINYEIPQEDIKLGGSYSENYQNGQRRTLSFSLYNDSGRYNPDINVFPVGTKIRFDMGAQLLDNSTLWFTKGVFVVNNITPSNTPSGREVSISCGDKFSLFDGILGRLPSSYEIPANVDIQEVLQSLLTTDPGNGTILDPKPMIYYSQFVGKRTQCSISKSAGDTVASLIAELALQLSAEYFYNSVGNLVFIPQSEVIDDFNKPLLYVFEDDDISQLSFSLAYTSIVNRVVVIGTSSSGAVYEATSVNDNANSPYCYQRIGYRTGDIIRESGITTKQLAQERADYELRSQSILKTSSTANILFNPLLEVNNLIGISDQFFDLIKERFLLQSISCSLDLSNQMSITFSNINNLPFVVR